MPEAFALCRFFADCHPLGAPRIAPAARRRIRKGRAGGRMRNKNGVCPTPRGELEASRAVTQALLERLDVESVKMAFSA